VGKQIALLRAVNVGKRQVPMARLRQLITDAGFEDVVTYLQSGNVVFADGGREPGENGERLEKLIEDEFGFTVEVVMRSLDQLEAVIARNPLPERTEDPKRYVVTFFADAPDHAAVAALEPEEFAPDEFAFDGLELFTWSPGGVHTSKFTQQFLKRKLGTQVATGRNWTTVLKLRDLAAH
jgi:uncharacterized protein (DUF1697 family)